MWTGSPDEDKVTAVENKNETEMGERNSGHRTHKEDEDTRQTQPTWDPIPTRGAGITYQR